MAKNDKMSAGEKAGLGVGLAAGMAAAALGAYFLYGSKNAAANRKKVKGWMLKARGEVLEQVENMGEVTEAAYGRAVDKVIASYKGAKNVSGPELMALAADLRRHWKAIKPMFQKGRSSGKSPGAKRRSSTGKKSSGRGRKPSAKSK